MEPNEYAMRLIEHKGRLRVLQEIAEDVAALSVNEPEALAIIAIIVRKYDEEQEAVEQVRRERQKVVQ